jgi:hypothetical protein
MIHSLLPPFNHFNVIQGRGSNGWPKVVSGQWQSLLPSPGERVTPSI